MIRKIITVALSAMILMSFAACNNQTQNNANGDPIKIGILQWVTHDALDQLQQGFVDALAKNGYRDGENMILDHQNANGDINIANSIASKFVNNKSDVVLAIATPAVQSMQSKTSTIPILGGAVTDYVAAKLIDSNQVPGGNISGTTDLTPISEQFDLLAEIVPNIKRVGIIYNSSETNSEVQVAMAEDYAKTKGIEVVVKTFTSTNDIQQTASSLSQDVEAFWLPNDNQLASSMDVLAKITTEANLPVICGDRAMLETGGVAAITTDYYALGQQSGEMAVRILRDDADIAQMPVEAVEDAKLLINLKNAQQIGLKIPQNIIDAAREVIE